jgi:hypothetical protein
MSDQAAPVTRAIDININVNGMPLPGPDLPRARAANVGWLREHGILRTGAAAQDYLQLRLAEAFAAIFPFTTGAEMDIAVDWAAWTFVYDDIMGSSFMAGNTARAGEIEGSLLAALDGAQVPETAFLYPVASSFGDLWSRQRTGMSGAWRARAMRNWENLIRAGAEEVLTRARGLELSVADSMALRRKSIAYDQALDLAERVYTGELPGRVSTSPVYAELRNTYVDIITLLNDFYGWRKEAGNGDPHCLVFILEREGLTREQAIGQTGDMLQAWLDRYAEIRDRDLAAQHADLDLTSDETGIVARHVETMNRVIHTTHRFMQELARYQGDTLPSAHPRYVADLISAYQDSPMRFQRPKAPSPAGSGQ